MGTRSRRVYLAWRGRRLRRVRPDVSVNAVVSAAYCAEERVLRGGRRGRPEVDVVEDRFGGVSFEIDRGVTCANVDVFDVVGDG